MIIGEAQERQLGCLAIRFQACQ